MKRTGAAALFVLAAASCDDKPAAPPPPESFQVRVPVNLRGLPPPSPERNPLTTAGVALGKRLFFDPRLSGNNHVSCASCHDPTLAFSDGNARSTGVSGKPLQRQTPPLINLAWMDGYFWDGGAKDLESQVFGPLTSPDEMDQSPSKLVTELRADPAYVETFRQAFPDGLTINNLVRAIAQYERTLISASSRYDHHVRGEPGGKMSDLEQTGAAVFRRACARCHTPDFFTDFAYHNNGLDDRYPEADEKIAWGRGRITHTEADIGKYKTPTLRNVAITAPYMHDGRFATLPEVLNHYRTGIRPSPTLDPLLARSGGISLTSEDVSALLAFLETLTDDTLQGRPDRP